MNKTFTSYTTPSACGRHPFNGLKGNLLRSLSLTFLRSYALTLFFLSSFFFLLSPFTAGAQCSDITMKATSTVATCYNNGTITVTITGADVGNVRLDNAQLKVIPDGAGTYLPPFTSPDLGNVKTITGIAGGSYTVEMEALCNDGGTYIPIKRTARVSVGTTWSTMYFWTNARRQTMNCKPTGEIQLDFWGGTPPYTINIIDAPSEYTGTNPITTSQTSYVLTTLPAGDYTFIANDLCGSYSPPTTTTVSAMGSDLPELYTYLNKRSGSCKAVTLSASFYTEMYMEYEYAYQANSSDPIIWKPCNSTSYNYDIDLPANSYADFCTSPYNFGTFHLRLKDCPSVTKSSNFLLNWSFCYPSGVVYTSFSNSCTSAKVQIGLNEAAICYPVNYTIALKSNPTNILESGQLTSQSSVVSTNDFVRGDEYMITFYESGSNGRSWSTIWEPSTSGMFNFTMYSENGYDCDINDKRICMYASSAHFYEGTQIKYVSGPDNFVLPMGPVNTVKIVDSPPWEGAYYGYAPGTDDYQSCDYTNLPKGEYVFEITDICGTTHTLSTELFDVDFEGPLAATATPTCSGLEVAITGGKMKNIFADGEDYGMTHYCAKLKSPNYDYERGVDNVWWNPEYSTSFPSFNPIYFQEAGTYKITVGDGTNWRNGGWYCPYDSLEFEYDGLPFSFNTTSLSSYFCDGQGHIFVQASGSIKPYEYCIFTPGSNPYTDTPLESNYTGKFDYGVAGATYDIVVKNICGAFTIPVTMRNLHTDGIAFTASNGKICEGEEVQLNAIGLGENITYTWLYPDGTTSNEQNPRFSAIYPTSSGTYYVTVQPEGCNDPVIDSLKITITQAPTAPEEIESSAGLILCEGEFTTLTAFGGEEGEESALYEWGEGNHCGWANAEFGSANFVTLVPRITEGYETKPTATYWVRRVGTGSCAETRTQCAKITMDIKRRSESRMIAVPEPVPVCEGAGTNITAYLLTGGFHGPKPVGTPIFRWYDSAFAEVPLYTGNPFPTGILTKHTTFWVSVECDNFCEGENSMYGRAPVVVEIDYSPNCCAKPTVIPKQICE